MPWTPEGLAAVRGWIGSEPADPVLEALYTQYENYDRVVLYVLQQRLSELTLEPSSFSVPGLSISNGSNIEALKLLMTNFRAQGGIDPALDDEEILGTRVSSIQRNYPR